jgi:RNA polymerase sigma-54 factor
MISNSLTTKLQQRFAPSQIQFMKLLQLPMQSLEGRIKEELEKNPVLEEDNSKESDDNLDLNQEQEAENRSEEEENEMEIYFQDDDIPDYRGKSEQKAELGSYYSSEKTLYEDLLNQLSLEDITKKEEIIGKEIIGNINDSGYLTRSIDAIVDDLLFSQNIEVEEKEVKKVLKVIQTFDPAGVGATSLNECLLLQMERYKEKDVDISLAKKILKNETLFSMFKNKQYQQLLLKLECKKEDLEKAIHQIKKLNPKPANSNEGVLTNVYITPDFLVWNNNGKVEFQLNKTFEHGLKISSYYSSMLEKMKHNKGNEDNKQAISFIKEKMDAASEFIIALNKRDDTLNNVMKAIIKFQYQYFLEGDMGKLKPMRLIDIATMTDNDVSTISRVASNKYCQTHFGLFLLKDFFSNAVEDKKGNKVSSDTIKSVLMQHIDNEDKNKPLTDDALVEIMQQEGYSLARRTIAKYRDSLNIPVARLRKTLS